jgi:hypothetical protein
MPKVAANNASKPAINDLSIKAAATARAVPYSIRDYQVLFLGAWGYCGRRALT